MYAGDSDAAGRRAAGTPVQVLSGPNLHGIASLDIPFVSNLANLYESLSDATVDRAGSIVFGRRSAAIRGRCGKHRYKTVRSAFDSRG